jgi:hypothetical protein
MTNLNYHVVRNIYFNTSFDAALIRKSYLGGGGNCACVEVVIGYKYNFLLRADIFVKINLCNHKIYVSNSINISLSKEIHKFSYG